MKFLRSHVLTPYIVYIDLEWKVLYVGSAEDVEHDQVLEEVMVGPVPVGINKFVLQVSQVFAFLHHQQHTICIHDFLHHPFPFSWNA